MLVQADDCQVFCLQEGPHSPTLCSAVKQIASSFGGSCPATVHAQLCSVALQWSEVHLHLLILPSVCEMSNEHQVDSITVAVLSHLLVAVNL